MSNLKKLGLAAVVIIAVAGLFFPKGREVVQQVLGADPGPVKTEQQELVGGVLYGNVNSTSTSADTYTLVANDLGIGGALFDTVVFRKIGPTGGGVVATTTFTFPASSTLSRFIPRTGQRAEQCWIVATTTNIGLIFVAGTGIDMQQATTSGPGQLTIRGGNTGCVKYTRQLDSDISADWTVYYTAD